MQNPYGIGDVVRLNSGGPEMTVLECSPMTAICKWHDGTEYSSVTFDVRTLTLIRRADQAE